MQRGLAVVGASSNQPRMPLKGIKVIGNPPNTIQPKLLGFAKRCIPRHGLSGRRNYKAAVKNRNGATMTGRFFIHFIVILRKIKIGRAAELAVAQLADFFLILHRLAKHVAGLAMH